MAIKKVTIGEDCTSCGMCEEICPEVFEMEDVATVKKGADLAANEDGIKEAADSCPVETIHVEEE